MTAKDWLPSAVLAAGMERVLSPGQALFRLGDRTAGIYEIVKGQVQMMRVDASGREVVLYAAGPGDIFAEAALFSPTYHCDAITKTGAVVRLFPKARVLPAFRENPKAAEAFMALLGAGDHAAADSSRATQYSFRPRAGSPLPRPQCRLRRAHGAVAQNVQGVRRGVGADPRSVLSRTCRFGR
jgi:CRP-like cAMP-binding protein